MSQEHRIERHLSRQRGAGLTARTISVDFGFLVPAQKKVTVACPEGQQVKRRKTIAAIDALPEAPGDELLEAKTVGTGNGFVPPVTGRVAKVRRKWTAEEEERCVAVWAGDGDSFVAGTMKRKRTTRRKPGATTADGEAIPDGQGKVQTSLTAQVVDAEQVAMDSVLDLSREDQAKLLRSAKGFRGGRRQKKDDVGKGSHPSYDAVSASEGGEEREHYGGTSRTTTQSKSLSQNNELPLPTPTAAEVHSTKPNRRKRGRDLLDVHAESAEQEYEEFVPGRKRALEEVDVNTSLRSPSPEKGKHIETLVKSKKARVRARGGFRTELTTKASFGVDEIAARLELRVADSVTEKLRGAQDYKLKTPAAAIRGNPSQAAANNRSIKQRNKKSILEAQSLSVHRETVADTSQPHVGSNDNGNAGSRSKRPNAAPPDQAQTRKTDRVGLRNLQPLKCDKQPPQSRSDEDDLEWLFAPQETKAPMGFSRAILPRAPRSDLMGLSTTVDLDLDDLVSNIASFATVPKVDVARAVTGRARGGKRQG